MTTIGIIGCGRIAKRHFEVLHGLPEAKLVGCCDVIGKRAEQYAEQYGIAAFDDYRKMIEATNPDVVEILTPSGNHAEIGLGAARLGRHLIIEKPMALRLEDADALIETCAGEGVKLFVVQQNRYNRPVQKLAAAVRTGRFGKAVLGTVRVRWCRPQAYYDQDSWRGTWAMDGGVLTNQASHHIDLLQWLLGPVRSVMAMATTRLAKIEAEDTGVAILRFASGALGVIEATTATRPRDLEGSLSLLGEKGSVEIGGFAVNKIRTWQFTEPLPEDETVLREYSENPPDVYGYGHREYLVRALKSVATGATAPVDGLEGRKSLELINAIYESVETGKEVTMIFNPHHCRLGQRS